MKKIISLCVLSLVAFSNTCFGIRPTGNRPEKPDGLIDPEQHLAYRTMQSIFRPHPQRPSEQSLTYSDIQSTFRPHIPSLLYLAARNRAEASSDDQKFSIETLPYDNIKKYVRYVKDVIQYEKLENFSWGNISLGKMSFRISEIDCPEEMFYKLNKKPELYEFPSSLWSRAFDKASDRKQLETMKRLFEHNCPFMLKYKNLKVILHDIPDSPIDALNTIQRGDINPKDALMKAAFLEHPETINAIIACQTISLHDKQVAFHVAVDHNSLQSCQALFDRIDDGFDLNQPLFGPGNHDHFLTSAALFNYPDIVTFLLDHGANVHINSALKVASTNGCVEAVKVLLEHGANARANNLKHICLYNFSDDSNSIKASIIRLLLAYGVDLDDFNRRDQEEYRQLLAEYPEEPEEHTASSSQQVRQ